MRIVMYISEKQDARETDFHCNISMTFYFTINKIVVQAASGISQVVPRQSRLTAFVSERLIQVYLLLIFRLFSFVQLSVGAEVF